MSLYILAMIPESFKTRFVFNGKLNQELKQIKKIVQNNPDSVFAKSVLKALYKKFWFGSSMISYSNIVENAWHSFFDNPNKPILDISGIKFVNDSALLGEFADIFLADSIHNYPIYNFNKTQIIAAKVLSILSKEGAYSFDHVYIKEGDVVIDIGANMGVFSLFATIQKAKRVYSFEPQKEVLEILKQNIENNEVQDIIDVVPLGLSDKSEDLLLSHASFGHTGASIVLSTGLDKVNTELIHCTTLDEWVVTNGITKVDFIKADIEGAERKMLIGATHVLKFFAPRLAICTYHLKDDPDVLEKIILDANPNYIIKHTSHKLFGYIPF